ncbi:MAG: NUDIX domain-containing protein [Candidatus Lindowbacteria bacterium]|nr:NUDIX domain-containing protein [Candidatus Lindowbacteria bacterium]
MSKTSAGLLVYRVRKGNPEVFLVHPGGPFWSKKDTGAWSIPKGEFTTEDPLEAARREFREETGFTAEGDFRPLTPVRQSSKKTVYVWVVEDDFGPAAIKSNTFSIEWPPRSGNQEEFPEIDRAEWFGLNDARQKILKGQVPFLEELEQMLRKDSEP